MRIVLFDSRLVDQEADQYYVKTKQNETKRE